LPTRCRVNPSAAAASVTDIQSESLASTIGR
jgi:hypothetical protein